MIWFCCVCERFQIGQAGPPGLEKTVMERLHQQPVHIQHIDDHDVILFVNPGDVAPQIELRVSRPACLFLERDFAAAVSGHCDKVGLAFGVM